MSAVAVQRRLKEEKNKLIEQYKVNKLGYSAQDTGMFTSIKDQFMRTLKGKFSTQNFNDGNVYEGEVNEYGERNGEGIMYFYDNPQKAANSMGAVYFGKWHKNHMQGIGVYIFENCERYEGELKNNMKNGVGKFLYLNGDIYKGGWLEDKRNGKGEMLYSNGDHYKGEYKLDLPEGYGEY